MTDHEKYQQLRQIMRSAAKIGAASSLCGWDLETIMPPAAAEVRSEVMAELASVIHERTTSSEVWDLLQELQSGRLSGREAANVRKLFRQIERERKLPSEFVRELSELTAASHHVWVEARKQSNFGIFRPNLERIVALKRHEADLVGYSGSPYDALIDAFEPGMTCARLDEIFGELQAFLQPLVARIAAVPDRAAHDNVRIPMAVADQRRLVADLAAQLGFDPAWGRIGEAAHPFSTRIHPGDLGITTAYNAADALEALYSTIHEVGHALYEAQLPQADWGLPLGEAISMGVHESQSRLWENVIGRSRPFCDRLHRLLAESGLDPALLPDEERLWRGINAVAPSLIRTEADEMTYNLHVILRFEIERDLIEGRLEVRDVPEAWNSRMLTLLGVRVPDDARGCLQDVHWSGGMFGYFPSYALGNLAATQIAAAAEQEIGLAQTVAVGDFARVRNWLQGNVHVQTDAANLDELMVKATGAPLDPACFRRYLEAKSRELFGL